jgi:hypothetical protein
MKIYDKFAWPVETIENRPIQSFLRYLIHGSIKQTWRFRNEHKRPRKTHRGESGPRTS